MRRCNMRILGIPETPESSITATVAKMLTEMLQLSKSPLVNRLHWTPGGKTSGETALAHYQDCMEILHHAHSLCIKKSPIIITADYASSVAKAWVAFTEVRRLLCGRQDVCYGLLFPAMLRITHGEVDKEFVDPDKAMASVTKNIISATGGEDSKKT